MAEFLTPLIPSATSRRRQLFPPIPPRKPFTFTVKQAVMGIEIIAQEAGVTVYQNTDMRHWKEYGQTMWMWSECSPCCMTQKTVFVVPAEVEHIVNASSSTTRMGKWMMHKVSKILSDNDIFRWLAPRHEQLYEERTRVKRDTAPKLRQVIVVTHLSDEPMTSALCYDCPSMDYPPDTERSEKKVELAT